jgi:hypothetical protein
MALGANVIQIEAGQIVLAVTGGALDVGMAFLAGGFGMCRRGEMNVVVTPAAILFIGGGVIRGARRQGERERDEGG